jgi:transcriptional regulator
MDDAPMYMPAHFEETRPEVLRQLVAEHPLGALVTLGPEGLNANHLPFLLEPEAGDRGRLIAHVARNNRAWQDVSADHQTDSLVIFQGASAYVSPNWYATKRETHRVVPTYNYAVVHAYGRVIVHEDAKWLRGAVGKLTKRMEASQPVPWKMGDAPADYLDAQLANIVGIEIPISRLIGKWKVSQNRPEADRIGAAAGLRSTGDPGDAAMADLVLTALRDQPT